MTSGVAVVMVMAVGLAALLRRGRRLAATYVAPLAACYIVWLLAIGREGGVTRNTSPGSVVRFVARGVRGAFGALGPFGWFGVVLAAVLVVGFWLAATQRRPSGEFASLAVPLSLVAGSIVFLALSATSGRRNTATSDALQSRYVSLVVAMTLPALRSPPTPWRADGGVLSRSGSRCSSSAFPTTCSRRDRPSAP